MCFALHGARGVTLTDKPEVVDHMRANVAINFEHDSLGNKIECVPFSWGDDPVEAGLRPPYDIVIGCDTIYHVAQIGSFVMALQALSSERTSVILALERREPAVWTAFLQALKAGFRLRTMPRKKVVQLVPEDEAAATHICLIVARRRNLKSPLPSVPFQQARNAALEPSQFMALSIV